MNVILHLGLAKTGTTLLQMWLYLNRHALAEHSFGAFDPLISHRIAVECLDDPDTVNRIDVVEIKTRMSLEAAWNNFEAASGTLCGETQYILSSEYLSVANSSIAKRLFDQKNCRIVQIILYLRRQDIYAAAGYAQDVVALKQRQPFICINSPPYGVDLNWARIRRDWGSSFPEASFAVRNYDKYRYRNLLLHDFCSSLGLPVIAGSANAERANESLNSEMTEFARMLNLHSRTVDRHRLLSLQDRCKGSPFGFSPQLTKMFEREYRSSNATLASEFPGELASLAGINWLPAGIDSTGMMLQARFDELCRAAS